jgi:hypothetical protein
VNGKCNESLEAFRKAEALDRKEYRILLLRAEILERCGRGQEGGADRDRLKKSRPLR